MRFLVSTDNHCGYAEVKKTNYDDAFVSLDEVFEKAREQQVDFVLLGGDLFHDNNPSRETRLRVIRIIRKHVLDGPPTQLEFVAKPENAFPQSAFNCVNFEDENLCVSMPVFSIHGNHDDLSGQSTSALDVLHEAGLINLFGRFAEVQKYVVDPVLLRSKNEDGTYEQVALYGIGSQRDDRLARAFNTGNITFKRPPDAQNWASVLVLHQNRPLRSTLRTTGAYVDAKKIPGFFNLVIWGHEHESIIEPQFVQTDDPENLHHGFYILQPGSTVVTSLTVDEAKPKHAFVVSFANGSKVPTIENIPLTTTRQVYVEEADLDILRLPPPAENVRMDGMADEKYFKERVNAILEHAEANRNPRQPHLPLIRIKMIYSGSWKKVPPMSARKVGVEFVGRVANATEILSIQRERGRTDTLPSGTLELNNYRNDEKASDIIQRLVTTYFENAPADARLKVLQNDAMFAAINEYHSSNSKATVLDSQLKECIRVQVQSFAEKMEDLTSNIDMAPTDTGYKEFEKHLDELVDSDNFSLSQFRPISQASTNYGAFTQDAPITQSNGGTFDV